MKSRRDRIDVIYDILTSIEKEGGKIKPTRLMYKSNLSYKLLKNYTDDLTEKKMIEEVKVKRKKFIILTENGKELINRLRKMRKFMDSFGL